MTRILLATLAFYRRWLSPALHSLGPGGCRYLPTCSEYAAGRHRHARPAARRRPGALEAAALPSFRARRARSCPRPQPQDLFPTNRYHRRSGGPDGCPFSNDRKYPLPEIRNPNLQTQGPAAAVVAAATCAPPWPSCCSWCRPLRLPVLLQAQAGPAAAPKRSRRRNAIAAGAAAQPASGRQAAQAGQHQPRRRVGSTPAVAASARDRDHRRKRALQDRLHQSRRAGEALDPEEVLRHGRQAARHGAAAGRGAFGLPLSLFTYEPALTTQLNQALYQVSGAQPSATGLVLAPNTLTFHYAANGLDVVKTFRFDSSYVVTSSPGQAQWRAGARAGAVACRPGRHGGVPSFVTTRSPGAHAVFLRLVARRQAGLAGRRQGERQRHARRSPTSTRPSPISTSPRPFCPTIPSAPPWSRCTTPSTCPAT
jgi:hypothetical protein